jgi:CAAX prenyl protease-like protein
MKQDQQKSSRRRVLSEEEWLVYQENRRATRAHVIPFVAWIACIFLVGQLALEDGSVVKAWVYAGQTVLGLALMVVLRPWQWYGAFQWRNLPLALVVGVGVFVVWVFPESAWLAERAPGLHAWYQRIFILPPWSVPDPPGISPYDPAVCGWGLSIMRIVGSAFVIAVAEEFFWRGWLYRWLLRENFLEADLGHWQTGMVLAVSAVFALEHMQWGVGFLAGLAYLWLMIRTRDLWAAIIAHVVTNLILGIYVIATESYNFW